jgi:type IV secretory pathway TrbL component
MVQSVSCGFEIMFEVVSKVEKVLVFSLTKYKEDQTFVYFHLLDLVKFLEFWFLDLGVTCFFFSTLSCS